MKKGLATPAIAYYVSGHGFGHARRTAQVLRALGNIRPDLRVIVRTAAPAVIFGGICNATVSAPAEPFDPGVVEHDTLTIDPAASVAQLARIMSRRDSIIETEAAFLRESGAGLVIADIPFLAADAAERAGIPAIAVGNFTWDWIFEPFVDASGMQLIEQIRQSHAKFQSLLHLPLGHEAIGFQKVIEVPLLAGPARMDGSTTVTLLGLDQTDPRPRILVALRGGLACDALQHAAAQSPDMIFIINQTVNDAPENLHCINATQAIDFSDILATCDAVISKLGYGILSDCIANRTALLYPPRQGFREDEISRLVCPQYIRMREISPQAFAAGDWRRELTALIKQPPPPLKPAFNGDEVIAKMISDLIPGRQ